MNSNSSQLPGKPRPTFLPEHEPWWKALTEHRILAQRCGECHQLRLYPRPMCDSCYSMDCDWIELSGQGTVHSWSMSHHAFNPGFKKDLPYMTVTVDLLEDLRLHAPLYGKGDQALSIGLPVVADFEDVDESYTRLLFKLAEQG